MIMAESIDLVSMNQWTGDGRSTGTKGLDECVNTNLIGQAGRPFGRGVFISMDNMKVKKYLGKIQVQVLVLFIDVFFYIAYSFLAYLRNTQYQASDSTIRFLDLNFVQYVTFEVLFKSGTANNTAVYCFVLVITAAGFWNCYKSSKEDPKKNLRSRSIKKSVRKWVVLLVILMGQPAIIGILSKPLGCLAHPSKYLDGPGIENLYLPRCLTYSPIVFVCLAFLLLYIILVLAVETMAYQRNLCESKVWSRYYLFTRKSFFFGVLQKVTMSTLIVLTNTTIIPDNLIHLIALSLSTTNLILQSSDSLKTLKHRASFNPNHQTFIKSILFIQIQTSLIFMLKNVSSMVITLDNSELPSGHRLGYILLAGSLRSLHSILSVQQTHHPNSGYSV